MVQIMPELADVCHEYRQRGWWRDDTFLDDLRRHAKQTPDKPAVIGHRNGAEQVITYAELEGWTEAFAARLLALGVKRGEAVAVQLPSWWEILPIGLACARVGAIFCPLMAIYRRRELEFILGLTQARVCITLAHWQGTPLGVVVADLAGELPELEHVFVAGGDGPSGTFSFERDFVGSLAQAPEPAEDLDGRELGPDEPFLLLFTSGTTGEAKGSLHSMNTLFASCDAYARALEQDATTLTFVCHQATHYSGFVTGMLVPMMLGGTAMLLEFWNVAEYLKIAPHHDVTTFYGAPPFLLELTAAAQAAGADLSGLKHVVTGSAPIPPSVVQRVRDGLGVTVVALWGMTENGAVTITRVDDPPDWPEHSDGSPLGGMEIRIDNSLVGETSDGSGAMWVRGPSQCLGYYKRDEVYAAALDTDGWFDTGDLARDDGRGGVRITGRVKDIVMHHSLNVPVGEVENALLRHPQVRDVAVIGVPVYADELTCAVVVAEGEVPTLESLRDFLTGGGFSEWFLPESLEIVDVLPRTITGKVRKVELRQQYSRL